MLINVFNRSRIIICSIIIVGFYIPTVIAQEARMPLLMPDDFSELHQVFWRVEHATPDTNNPLLEGDMPWDAGGIGVHGTVLKDPIDGLWKAWLVCTPPVEEIEGVTLRGFATQNYHLRRLCYFESPDGVNWTRPELNNFPFGEYKATNIALDESRGFGTQYASVSVDPTNSDYPYEMFVYREIYNYDNPPPEGYTHLHRYRSHDGREWETVASFIKGPMKGDVCYVYPDEDEGYITYYRLGTEVEEDEIIHIPVWEGAGRNTRQIYRTVSRDGENWEQIEKIMKRDERDHIDAQYMELVPHKVKGGYLGIVSMYFPLTQTQNLRMAVSRDGKKWWFPDRRPCLDNAPLGDYGGGMIWQSKNLIVEGEALYVYYGGMEGLHRPIFDTRAKGYVQIGMEKVHNYVTGFLPFNSALCRASWRFDRMYALVPAAGGPTIGKAVTKSQQLTGKQLWVNFATRPPKKSKKPGFDEGYLQVELLNEAGEPLAGFTRNDCICINGDHQAFLVKWKGGDRAPENAVKAKFYLKRAFLYGFEFIQLQ